MTNKVEEGLEPKKANNTEIPKPTPAEEIRIQIDKSEEAGEEKFIPAKKMEE